MKIAVRALVVVLALTGAAATASMNNSSSSTTPTLSRTSAYPVPTCYPGDPTCSGTH